jgi:hypothetical protein
VTDEFYDLPPAGPAPPARRAARRGQDLRLGRVALGAVLVVLVSAALTLGLAALHAVRLLFAEQSPPDPEVVEAYLRRIGFWFPVVWNVILTFIVARKIALRVRRDGGVHGMLLGAAVGLLDLVAVIVGAGHVAGWLGGLGLLVVVGWLGGALGDRTREHRLFTR